MHETLIIDLYAWLALAIYLGVVAAVSLLRVVKDAGGRGRGYGAVKGALSAAGKGPEDLAWAPLADGRFLVYAAGGRAAVVGGESHRPDVLQPVTRVALVKDMDQQTGLVLTVQGEDLCVTGLDHMARVWAVLQRDETRVRIVFREDEGATVQAALNALAPNERSLVGQWLAEEEIVTDVIVGVDYQGTVNAGAEKSQATLIVTNFRVGLLAQTKTTVHQGNQIQTTTHFNLITYLLPVAECVTFERTAAIGKQEYAVRLELPEEHAAADAPVLLLTPDHAGMLLPVVLFGRSVRVIETAASAGRWAWETFKSGFGLAIWWGGLGLVAALIITEGDVLGHGSWYYRYSVPIIVAAALTPGIVRGASLLIDRAERGRAAAVPGAAAACAGRA
jgi:hypothetical protein